MRTNDKKAIVSYYLSEEKETILLSEYQTFLVKCLDYVKDCLREERTRKKVIDTLKKEFECKHSLSYELYDFGLEVFDIRKIRIENTFEEIKHTKELALLKQDFRSAAQCDKNRIEAIVKFHGDNEAATYDSLQPVDVEIGFFPALLNTHLPDENTLNEFTKMVRDKKLKKQLQTEIPITQNAQFEVISE